MIKLFSFVLSFSVDLFRPRPQITDYSATSGQAWKPDPTKYLKIMQTGWA
jgi:hypothetical protein